MTFRFLLIILSMITADAPLAEEPRFRPLRMELISEFDSIQPGQRFHLGVRQRIAPGYHSYWRNPGTVGMPMQASWKLPPGFTAGDLLWPIPESGKMAAYTIWGYHDEALLATEIMVPTNAVPGTASTFTLAANWMCCGEACFPDNETLSITLPITEATRTNTSAHAAISRTLAAQPRSSDRWRVSVSTESDRYELRISPSSGLVRLPTSARFFDYDRQVSSDKGQAVHRSNNALRITLHQEEHTGDRLPRLRGMLVTDGYWEAGLKALAVDIPIPGR